MASLLQDTRTLRLSLRAFLALPDGIVDRITGPPPRNDRGTPLARATWRMLWLERRVPGQGLKARSPQVARRAMIHSVGIVQGRRPDVPTEPLDLPDAPPMRRYGRGPAGLVWLHGGGWVAGDLDTHDVLCRRLALEAGLQVLSVDYRRAPEAPFPAALDDTLAAWTAVQAATSTLGLDPSRLGLGGDSAGGNLTAAACQLLRDRGLPRPAGQVLAYPALDMRCLAPSHQRFASGYVLEEAGIRWYLDQYAAPDPLDPRASPGLAEDLAGLPPAVVTTAGFDPLRDEGEAYAARLAEADVPVVHLDEADQVHGYLNCDGALPEADAAVTRLARACAELLRG